MGTRKNYGNRKIFFYDWDDSILGVLVLSKVIEDARPFVNFFVQVNMVHPELRQRELKDSWEDERREKREAAVRRWPRRSIYPEESFTAYLDENGELQIEHGLRYVAWGYPDDGKSSRINPSYPPERFRDGYRPYPGRER